mmetsp:Transcript_47628/g.102661  ORF Transcript_47628/g.102661 Transcript_47628/m.102661 type:complete len:218 (+) Transcript_47628:649-1302(+)
MASTIAPTAAATIVMVLLLLLMVTMMVMVMVVVVLAAAMAAATAATVPPAAVGATVLLLAVWHRGIVVVPILWLLPAMLLLLLLLLVRSNNTQAPNRRAAGDRSIVVRWVAALGIRRGRRDDSGAVGLGLGVLQGLPPTLPSPDAMVEGTLSDALGHPSDLVVRQPMQRQSAMHSPLPLLFVLVPMDTKVAGAAIVHPRDTKAIDVVAFARRVHVDP